jgi:hypothetical protein
MLRKLGEMMGFAIRGTDGDIGKVYDFYFDDANWILCYVVVDTGPWLFGRKVLISPAALGSPNWEARALPVSLTREQVRNSPNIDLAKPVSRQQIAQLHEHYGWPATWTDSPLLGTTYIAPHPVIRTEEPQQGGAVAVEQGHRHLRSAKEVIGYHAEALDGEVGRVDEMFVDETDWVIRYLVVDAHNWLPRREVLVGCDWIEHVGWTDQEVNINLSREEIENSPAYDPERPLSRAYEARLYGHYGLPGYWV